MVEMRGIIKRFPGVLANNHINFDLNRGEIHALLGENGAGKSTLMNILAGMYQPEGGIITVNSKPVHFSSPREAINAGIGMVHQHFMLVPTQTVTENILLGLDDPRFNLNLPHYDTIVSDLRQTFWIERGSTSQNLAAFCGRAATCRNFEDALSRRSGADHG